MKPTVVDEEEDDLQAEEENKLINEVRVILTQAKVFGLTLTYPSGI